MGNCFSSPQPELKQPAAAIPAPEQQQAPAVTASAPTAPQAAENNVKMVKRIAIIFYSTYGHVYQMAQKVKEGVDSVEGCEGVLFQVPETLPTEVLEKMHAAPKPDVPVITADQLPEFDGFIFGVPTRFGMMAAQMKSFLDSTGGLWAKGALVGKPASVFVSVGTQGGGTETTALTFVTQLAHHGMVFVPTGYSFGERLFAMDEVRGGSPYGASTFAGPTGARQPSELELDFAKHQGSYFAGVAKKLAA